MQADDSVKVIIKNLYAGVAGQQAIPVNFGIGHKDSAVQLLGITYSVKGESNAEFGYYAICLCEDPRLLATPPTVFQMFNLDSCYALVSKPIVRSSFIDLLKATSHIPLYGLLRPFRQLLCLDMSYDAAVRFKVEIFYQVIRISPEESSALARQKGAYRRT